MRKAKNKNADTPDKYKKIDTMVNGDAERLVETQREVEKKLYPLRIDSRTVIYVTKDKCTPEYAAKKRKEFGLAQTVEVKGHASKTATVDVERLRKMVGDGMKLKDIAPVFGISRTLVSRYIKEYGLRDKE